MEQVGRRELPAFQGDGRVNVIIETPKGSRNKYKHDPETGLFELSGVLAVGASFPFDFGYVPSTLGQDGDPLDLLLLMDEPAFPGCLVVCRLIGAIKAEQSEGDETVRNDRLIAVADKSPTHQDIKRLDDLNDYLLDQIEHFFVSYNAIKGKEFKPLGRCSPDDAAELVEEAVARYRTEQEKRLLGRKAA